MVQELECPWCNAVWPHVRTRCHDAGDEFRCAHCGEVHTRKLEDPEHAYAFFPGDIAATVRDGN